MTYQTNIPMGSTFLSVDYANIQSNFAALNTIFAINHFPLTATAPNVGKHTFIEMPTLGNAVINFNAANTYVTPSLVVLAPGESVLFSNKTTGTGQSGSADLIYTNGNSGNSYQMTLVDNPNYGTFGNFTNYPTMVTDQFGGWTFLPGGLILQYGHMKTTSGTDTAVVFPKPFKDTTV